jgi:hypothetical protein
MTPDLEHILRVARARGIVIEQRPCGGLRIVHPRGRVVYLSNVRQLTWRDI